MGDFRRDNREDRGSRGFGRDRDNRGFGGGRSFGGRNSGGRSFSGGRDRRSMEMCDAVCAKCNKDCKVPFKPTGDKPVLCSDCFRAQGNTHTPNMTGNSSSITPEQFKELNSKLDKILEILENVEFEEVEDDAEEDSEETEETQK